MQNKKIQKAGRGSQQIQTDYLTIQNGIDEKRVREIFDEKMLHELDNFSQEALRTAQDRISDFSKALIPLMAQNSALSAFGDPSFQLLLVEAQKSAASSERLLDYDMLSELMLDRFKKSSSGSAVIGISRAVEIINQVSDEALLGLTIFNAVERFQPQNGNMADGLTVLDEFYSKLVPNEASLPTKTDWLDQLDILNALRVAFNDLNGTKKLGDFWYEKFHGYVSYGIKKDSEEYVAAAEELRKVDLNWTLLLDSEHDKDYVRLPVIGKSSIRSLTMNRRSARSNGKIVYKTTLVTEKEVQALEAIYDKYDNSAMLAKEKFISELDKYDNLKMLREWWDALSGHSIEITVVGRVLAHANAQRLDPRSPKLDI